MKTNQSENLEELRNLSNHLLIRLDQLSQQTAQVDLDTLNFSEIFSLQFLYDIFESIKNNLIIQILTFVIIIVVIKVCIDNIFH